MEVRVFLVGMMMLYQKKYLLVHLLDWVHLGYMSVLSKMVVVRWCRGGGGLVVFEAFLRICSEVGVEPRQSDGIIEMLCCEVSVGISGNVLLESSEVLGVSD